MPQISQCIYSYAPDDEDEESQEINDFNEAEDSFNNMIEDVVDSEMAKKNKPPTGPSSMVIFYTWMVVALLLIVIAVSTYQSRCKGVKVRDIHSHTCYCTLY